MKSRPGASRRSRRNIVGITVLALLAVLVPYWVWQETWFGRSLSDQEIERYLHQDNRPRRIQHALSQLSDRMMNGDATAKPYYPRIVELASHPSPAIRSMVAWTLGQDNSSQSFHTALYALVRDPDEIVRRNAALSLVRHGDPRGRGVLVSMLEPYLVRASTAGHTSMLVETGQAIGQGALLARIRVEEGQEIEVHAPFAGTIQDLLKRDGAITDAGDPLIELQAEADQVWEALRGLYLVGREEDLPPIEALHQRAANMPERISRQATLTAQAIRTRSEQNPTR